MQSQEITHMAKLCLEETCIENGHCVHTVVFIILGLLCPALGVLGIQVPVLNGIIYLNRH